MAKAAAEVEDLPRANVQRVVKDKLSQCSKGEDISIQKDSLLAFSESARIFIHYLSATADDICKESKRQTINADDVLKALEEIEFPEFIGSLKFALDDFRQKNAAKKAETKGREADKKRKMEEDTLVPNGKDDGDGEEAADEDEDNAGDNDK